MIKILFFAALREQLNCENTSIESAKVKTIDEVISHLISQNNQWEKAFNSSLLFAVNQEMVTRDFIVKDGDEVAFFPPVTGG